MPATPNATMDHALDGKVDGLGSTRCPDDLPGIGVDELRYMCTSVVHRLLGLLTEAVRAGCRIAEGTVPPQATDHSLYDLWGNRRRGGVVQVSHDSGLPPKSGVAAHLLSRPKVTRPAPQSLGQRTEERKSRPAPQHMPGAVNR